MVNVEVVVRFVVDVVVQGREVGRGSGSDEDRVGREDFKRFAVDVLLFRLPKSNEGLWSVTRR